MIYLRHLVLSVISLTATAVPVGAQTWVSQNWSEAQQESASNITAQLNRQASFNVATGREFGPAVEFASDFTPPEARNPFAAITTRDVWHEAEGYSDRLRLRARGEMRRADGSPVPLTPMDQAVFDADEQKQDEAADDAHQGEPQHQALENGGRTGHATASRIR